MSRDFRVRRAQNWVTLGFTYAAFYTGRYNLGVASKTLSDQFGWDKAHIGWIITWGLATYGVSTWINGPLTDRYGGRRMLLIGTFGAMVCNLLFGVGSFFTAPQARDWLLIYLVVIFAINNYFQSFGACAIIKVNAPWFRREERGVFSGIFGSMIQLGRALVLAAGPWILTFAPWRFLFFAPAAILGLMFVLVWRFVVDAPEDVGFPQVVPPEGGDVGEHASFSYVMKRVVTNPLMLSLAFCSFCIGFSRQGMDQWMVRYFQEAHHLPGTSYIFRVIGVGAPFLGVLGAMVAGTSSDKLFGSRRPPVIFIFFVGQLLAFALLASATTPLLGSVALSLASFCISGSHSLLLGACTIDFGGRRAVATAAGFFDGLQYLAGAVAGRPLGGWLEDHGWGIWPYALMPTAFCGMLIMLKLWNLTPETAVGVAPAKEAA